MREEYLAVQSYEGLAISSAVSGQACSNPIGHADCSSLALGVSNDHSKIKLQSLQFKYLDAHVTSHALHLPR